MTALDLNAIKARCEAATPGPWEGDGTEVYGRWEDGRPWLAESCRLNDPKADHDAAFIAHARADVPALVAEVEYLRAWVSSLLDKMDVPL